MLRSIYLMPCEVLLVDDHKILRDGIKAILERSGEFRVVAEAGNGPNALQLVRKLRPRLVLMDIGMPGLDGVETTAEILRIDPTCSVAILSMFDDHHSVVNAMRAGARAFILKRASDLDLVGALRMVASGGMYVSPEVSNLVLDQMKRGDGKLRPVSSALDGLSPREQQVMRLVADGKTSKEIAVLLDLREQTVRTYRKTMMKKLGINNAPKLTQLALTLGIMPVSRVHGM